MWEFNIITKEDIPHDQEVNIRPMCGDDYQWAELLFIMVTQFNQGLNIDNYLLVNGLEYLVQEPCK